MSLLIFFFANLAVNVTIFRTFHDLCVMYLNMLILVCVFFELLHIFWVITFVISFLQFCTCFFLANFAIGCICYFCYILTISFFATIIKVIIFISQFRIFFFHFLHLGFTVIIVFFGFFQRLCVDFVSFAILNFIQRAIIKIFGSFFGFR